MPVKAEKEPIRHFNQGYYAVPVPSACCNCSILSLSDVDHSPPTTSRKLQLTSESAIIEQ
jgi:hypothetical protein